MSGKNALRRWISAALTSLVLLVPAGALAYDGNNNSSGNNNEGNRGSRGRGLSELMFLIVKLTGEENWGQVRVIGPAADNDREEESDSRDYF